MSKPITVSEFARRVGVSHTAVQKAIEKGRLRDSVSVARNAKGHWKIVDIEQAEKDWQEGSSRLTKLGMKAPPAVVAVAPVTEVKEPARSSPPAESVPVVRDERPLEDSPASEPVVTMLEAQRQVALERARALKIANDVREGQLIDARQAHRHAAEAARAIRESVQNVAPRIFAELAAETDPNVVFTRMDAEYRQALTVAADLIEAFEAAERATKAS